jgi:integral membrane protein
MKKMQLEMNTKSESQSKTITLFKIISSLEGLSYILLLFVAVPLKYLSDNSSLVKSLGMPHGLLFIAYILIALFIRSRMKWDFKTTFIVLVASLLPFGTFYVNKKYV